MHWEKFLTLSSTNALSMNNPNFFPWKNIRKFISQIPRDRHQIGSFAFLSYGTYLQPSGQAMVGLKLWFQWLFCSPWLFLFLPFFVICHTTELGMKHLLKAQQWWVEGDSNLIPPQYRLNALTTTPCSPLSIHFKQCQAFDRIFFQRIGDFQMSKK